MPGVDDAIIKVELDTKDVEKDFENLSREMLSYTKDMDRLDARAAQTGISFLERVNKATGKIETYWALDRGALERNVAGGAFTGLMNGGFGGALVGAARGTGITQALKAWAGSETGKAALGSAVPMAGQAYAAAMAIEQFTPLVTGIIEGILKDAGTKSPLFKQWIEPVMEGLSAKVTELTAKLASIMPAMADATANAKAELRLGGTLTPSKHLAYFEQMREFHEAENRIKRAHEKSADRELARNLGVMLHKAAFG